MSSEENGSKTTSRRRLMMTAGAAALGFSGVALAARRAAIQSGLVPPDSGGLYGCGHTLTYAAQRLLTRHANAREFSRAQISRTPHPKGNPPKGDEFANLQAGGFKDWRLAIDGLVSRPRSFSVAELHRFPQRSHVTQLICEEGWSYIAEWTGAPFSQVLEEAGVRPEAKFAVYYSMDGWVDAIDMDEARHGQTLVSYAMNGSDLAVGHGGPLRMRVPKQLGYKNVKFLNRVTLTDSLQGLPMGGAYSWYAGI